MSATQEALIADSFYAYKRPYVKPSSKISKLIVKITSQPSSQTITNAPSKMIIQLPTDLRMVGYPVLKVNASCTQSGGTYVRFKDPFSILGNTLLTIGGNQMYQNLQESRVTAAELEAGTTSIFSQTDGAAVLGFGTATTRNSWATGRDYYIPLLMGGMFKRPFPTPLINNQLQIEITPLAASACLETDGTSYSYTINNMQVVIWYLKEEQSEIQKLRAICEAQGGVAVPFQYKAIEGTTLQSNNTSLFYNLQQKSYSINRLAFWFVPQANENNPAVNDLYRTYSYTSTDSYQFTVNGITVPQQIVDCSGYAVESWDEMVYSFNPDNTTDVDGRYEPSGPSFFGGDYTVDKFIMSYSFASPFYAQDAFVPLVGSGVNTAASNSQLSINIYKGSDSTVYDFWVVSYSDALILISPTGAAQLVLNL